jgi:HAMP domain-containing protein
VRRLVKLAVIALGIRALWRWRRRRQERAAELAPAAPVAAGDPADELRRKLAESREEDSPETVTVPETSVEERRTQVHEQARAALDDMASAAEE